MNAVRAIEILAAIAASIGLWAFIDMKMRVNRIRKIQRQAHVGAELRAWMDEMGYDE